MVIPLIPVRMEEENESKQKEKQQKYSCLQSDKESIDQVILAYKKGFHLLVEAQ